MNDTTPSKCRPDYEHVAPCGPVDGPYGDEQCACGCRADDWWCGQ